MTMITLNEPIQIQGAYVRAVTLRMPSEHALAELSAIVDRLDAALATISVCTELPADVVDELSADDMFRLVDAIRAFIHASGR